MNNNANNLKRTENLRPTSHNKTCSTQFLTSFISQFVRVVMSEFVSKKTKLHMNYCFTTMFTPYKTTIHFLNEDAENYDTPMEFS